jgi:hypothetical protein
VAWGGSLAAASFERAWARIVNHDAVEKTVELLGKPVGSQSSDA